MSSIPQTLSQTTPFEFLGPQVEFVRRALARLGVCSADVDDLSQEVFLLLHRRHQTFENSKHARSWLYGTARRVASNHRRSRARAKLREEHAPQPVPALLPDAHLERMEAGRTLERFVGSLCGHAQQVFVLSEVEGLSGPDVAARLGIPLNTTYSHLRRVRSRLKAAALVFALVVLAVISMLAGGCAADGAGADDAPRVALRSHPGSAS